jgi:hypothetical protein
VHVTKKVRVRILVSEMERHRGWENTEEEEDTCVRRRIHV